MSYVPLWCKSNYSFTEGASHPEELVTRAAALGLPAIAVTDRDGLYAAVATHLSGLEHGVKVIHGAQITVDDGSFVLLLVIDHTGYIHLCQLITRGRLRHPKGFSSVSWEEIREFSPGLIAVLVDNGRYLPTKAPIPELKAAFPGRLYAGLSRHYVHREVPREDDMRSLAEIHGLPLVAAPEVLYHHSSRKPLQDVLTCIRNNTTLEKAGTLLTPNDRFALPDPADFRRRFADDPTLTERTLEIAEQCTFSLSEIEYRYPSESLPTGYTSAEWLRHLTFEGARKRYSSGIPANVRRRLERELDIIDYLDYCGYFLTMWEIVEYCREKEILCQGRGSAANSTVCYCLGITAIDPVRMDLLFERFLSKERAEPPDIDLDIEHNRREEVIQHMYRKYGRSHAAMVANIIRYRRKSAIREVGRVLGFPETTLDRCSRLTSRSSADVGEILGEGGLDPDNPRVAVFIDRVNEILEFPRHLSIHPGGFLLGSDPVSHLVPVENATMPDRTVVQWDKYDIEHMNLFKVDLLGLGALTHLDIAFRLLQKHYGVTLGMATIPAHDPAVFQMISRADTVGVFQIESRAQMAMLPRLRPRRFYDLVIEVSIVRPGPITGGMVHPYLARRNGEEPIIYPHESLRPVLEKTLGVPLFQEQVMKLAVTAADYTPGEADQLRRDMAAWRKSGRIEQHREKLISRMVAKGIAGEFAERVYDQIRGFGDYGFPESHAASFALIAWSTAWVKYHYPDVFACALLNAWPMGFYAPSTIVEDAKRHGVEIRPVDVCYSEWECTLERAGAPQEGPVSTGGVDPGSRAGCGSLRGAASPPFAVRMGLRYVRGMSRADFDRVAPAREAAPATVKETRTGGTAGAGAPALREFVRKSRLDSDVLETLARAGALRSFGVKRRDALWRVLGKRDDNASRYVHGGRSVPAGRDEVVGADGSSTAVSSEAEPASVPTPFTQLPVGDLDAFDDAQTHPRFSELNDFESVAWDYGTTRHSTEGHPLESYREALSKRGLPDARRLNDTANGRRVSYAGIVICRQRPGTASGTVFMTMEDETGFVNLIVWKKTFEEYRSLIITSSFLGVSGRLQNEDGVAHIIVDSVWRPQVDTAPVTPRSRDFH
ncbi:MAG: error-prone DNA polymerase [Spirochaetaceae bacterium]